MNILSVTGVGVSVGPDRLFDDATLGIDDDEKVGLVGRNGSGKSTFLRVVSGEIEPDDGAVARSRGLRISTLEQRPKAVPGLTIRDYLWTEPGGSQPGPADVADAATAAEHHSAVNTARASEQQAEAAQRYEAICHQLGLVDTGAPLDTLSGGMLKKAALARTLALPSDFIILDEPTNHLDIESVEWLEQRLKSPKDAFLIVTHDRYILDAVCTTILEIDRGSVYRYEGNYSSYLQQRAERLNELDKAEQRRTSILRTELEWLKRGPKARTGKDKKRKERIGELLEGGMESESSMDALPAAQRRLGKKALELREVTKSFDGRQVIAPFSRDFAPGERVGIIGPNGSGKSTFLDLIAGRTQPDAGSVIAGETTAVAYFDQRSMRIDESLTVLEYMKESAERVSIDRNTSVPVEQFLERFLFPPSMHRQPVGRLSGGELRRLYLVRLLAGAPNFLLFDEPTNDLDLDTLRVLEQYLDEFTGSIFLVSHDRALLNRVTDSLLVSEGDGTVSYVTGSYEEFQRSRRAAAGGRATDTGGKPKSNSGGVSRAGRSRAANGAERAAPDPRKRRLSFKEKREFEHLLEEIEATEAEIKQLEEQFQQSVHDPDELAEQTRRYHELQELVETKTARWEELAERTEE